MSKIYLYSREDRVCEESCNFFILSLKVSGIVAQKSGKQYIYTIVIFLMRLNYENIFPILVSRKYNGSIFDGVASGFVSRGTS